MYTCFLLKTGLINGLTKVTPTARETKLRFFSALWPSMLYPTTPAPSLSLAPSLSHGAREQRRTNAEWQVFHALMVMVKREIHSILEWCIYTELPAHTHIHTHTHTQSCTSTTTNADICTMHTFLLVHLKPTLATLLFCRPPTQRLTYKHTVYLSMYLYARQKRTRI